MSTSHFQNLLTLLCNRNKIKASDRTIRLLFKAQGRTGSAGDLEKIRTPAPHRQVFITCLSTWHFAEPNIKDKYYRSGRADKGKHISKIAQKVSLASLFWFRRRLPSRLRNKSHHFPALARRDSAAKSWAPDFKPLALLPGCLKN